jgi:DNA gyrase subunit B
VTPLSENPAPETESYDGSQIQVLEGLSAVRKRPGMYIGSTGERGLHHLVWEVVDNSVDEAMAGHATGIDVTLLANGGVRVSDDGRGIPVDIHPTEGKPTLEVVLTVLHAGGKFGGGGYSVSGGLHGVGISVVNALSTRVEVEVKRGGAFHKMAFVNGGTTEGALVSKPGADGTGTTVTFWADPAIFETTTYSWETLATRFQQMAFLNKGLRIALTDEREPQDDGTFKSVTYCYENGLVDFVDHLNRARTTVHASVIEVSAEGDGQAVEIAMQWTDSYQPNVRSFANAITTHEGGTHEEGFRTALTSVINKYAREKNLLKEKDENLTGDDIREGLTAIISVKVSEPQFEGQTKSKLGNSEI